MPPQKLINILAAIIFAFIGWWTNVTWNSVQNLQQQVSQLNVELAKNYVPRLELQSTFDRIFVKLDEIQKYQRGDK